MCVCAHCWFEFVSKALQIDVLSVLVCVSFNIYLYALWMCTTRIHVTRFEQIVHKFLFAWAHTASLFIVHISHYSNVCILFFFSYTRRWNRHQTRKSTLNCQFVLFAHVAIVIHTIKDIELNALGSLIMLYVWMKSILSSLFLRCRVVIPVLLFSMRECRLILSLAL